MSSGASDVGLARTSMGCPLEATSLEIRHVWRGAYHSVFQVLPKAKRCGNIGEVKAHSSFSVACPLKIELLILGSAEQKPKCLLRPEEHAANLLENNNGHSRHPP